jgi:HAD superfamily phosphoserine phosphatase-like hydrolase
MANQINRVFVSSTFIDLQEHRTAVREAIRQLGAIDIAMENFGARDERPKDECFRIIREETEVFVGIYAYRYGFIPEADDISITESEFLEAFRHKVPTYLYVVDGKYDWPQALKDLDEPARKLNDFKTRLQRDRIVATFTTPDNLARKIAADLGRHFSNQDDPETREYGLLHQPPAEWLSPIQRNPWRYKVVAFDLDGTLLRAPGFSFSWELIWRGLGFGKGIQNELKREYRQRTAPDTTKDARIKAYQDWCDKAVAQFKARDLTRSKITDLCQQLSLTQQCREALTRLRQEGVVTALISGGVNTVLEDRFPDFRDYMDFVFINELVFTEDGHLDGVLATAYDFNGKADALDVVCEKVGCSPDETVFVGDHFNDEMIMLKASKAIAYPPQDDIAQNASQVSIAEDNLMLIVPHVLVE